MCEVKVTLWLVHTVVAEAVMVSAGVTKGLTVNVMTFDVAVPGAVTQVAFEVITSVITSPFAGVALT